jgi:hypothetical protein
MLILTVWLATMGAGGLCYPRWPRAAGVLFLMLGAFMFFVWAAGVIGDAPPVNAAAPAALGLATLLRFRNPAIRAAHVAEWTGKA